ncbi:MAG TPA: amino acid ABC transporter permease [Trueperaceae bacterium]
MRVQDSAVPTEVRSSSAIRWVRENLFSSIANSLLTLTTAVALGALLRGLLRWAFTEANWSVVPANFRLLMVGPYPIDEMWRIWVGVTALSLVLGFQWGRARRANPVLFVVLAITAVALLVLQGNPLVRTFGAAAVGAIFVGYLIAWFTRPSKRLLAVFWTVVFFGFIYLLGANLGGGGVSSNLWGGLLLTLLISIVAIVASFPIGVVLAVARTSKLPIISMLAASYIELVRGVPLLVVLFLAQLFVPLFLPDFPIPKVTRAIIGIALFQAAYVAENVRGGLQSVAIGQSEAARALGLTGFQTLRLIVLPQALKAVIPANTGQFIQLFKETSLVSIVGLTDLLGMGNVIVNNPDWLGLYKEVYIAIALIYAVFSYAMSSASYALEKRLAR